jgi:hypothetical protein
LDFSFSDPLPDSAEESEQAFFPVVGELQAAINRGLYEHRW